MGLQEATHHQKYERERDPTAAAAAAPPPDEHHRRSAASLCLRVSSLHQPRPASTAVTWGPLVRDTARASRMPLRTPCATLPRHISLCLQALTSSHFRDHCNGLLMLGDYVLNPAMRRWANAAPHFLPSSSSVSITRIHPPSNHPPQRLLLFDPSVIRGALRCLTDFIEAHKYHTNGNAKHPSPTFPQILDLQSPGYLAPKLDPALAVKAHCPWVLPLLQYSGVYEQALPQQQHHSLQLQQMISFRNGQQQLLGTPLPLLPPLFMATEAVLDQQESFKLCDKEAKLKFPGILPGNDCVGSSSASPPRQEANKKQARQDHGEQPSGTKANLKGVGCPMSLISWNCRVRRLIISPA
nr:unnamed protein product [Digitaria exilis]